ncbi:MAG: transglycosylase SLT domain-containing protein [bacterium]
MSIDSINPASNGPHKVDQPQQSAQKKERSPRELGQLKRAAQDFEAIFISQILQNMRRSMKSGLFGDGVSSDIYNSMFDENIAKAIASKDGFGLSDIIIKSLQKDTGTEDRTVGQTLADYWRRPVRASAGRKVNRNWDRAIISEAANKYGVDAKLVEAIIRVESNYNAKAVSKKGAAGLMQLMKETARALGVKNRFDPRENVFAGVKYFRGLLARYDDNVELALGAYNAGPAAVEKYNGIPPYDETRQYVQKVLQAYRDL